MLGQTCASAFLKIQSEFTPLPPTALRWPGKGAGFIAVVRWQLPTEWHPASTCTSVGKAKEPFCMKRNVNHKIIIKFETFQFEIL